MLVKALKSKVLLGSVLVAGSVGSALAVPPDVSGFTDAAADATSVATTMFAVIAPVVAGIVILKLAIRIGKSMLNKAT